MIEMPVADDQCVNLLHVDAHDAHVVDKHVGRVAVVQHQGAGLIAALGFEPERQAPLGVNHIGKPRRDGGWLHAHAVDRAGAQEKIVGGVDEYLDRELIHHRHLDWRRRGELDALETVAHCQSGEHRSANEEVTPS